VHVKLWNCLNYSTYCTLCAYTALLELIINTHTMCARCKHSTCILVWHTHAHKFVYNAHNWHVNLALFTKTLHTSMHSPWCYTTALFTILYTNTFRFSLIFQTQQITFSRTPDNAPDHSDHISGPTSTNITPENKLMVFKMWA